jgi:hypothetical protein
LAGGVADTSFGPVNGRNAESESSKTYMGSLIVALPDSFGPLAGSVVYAGIVDGSPFDSTEDALHVYVGGTARTPITGLSLGVAWDYRKDGPVLPNQGFLNNTPDGYTPGELTTPPNHSSRAYALAGYLSYEASENLRANARIDYLNADIDTFTAGASGDRAKLLATTLTLDYALWDMVITRAELRWDHSLNSYRPYGNANDKDAWTLAGNIIYKF